jgi:hypothetical protein
VVLFGAGASAGSGWVTPYSPPLGLQLFDQLERFGQVAAALPDQIKLALREDFESGTRQLAIHDSRLLIQFQKEMSRYLIQFSAGPGNLYRSVFKAFLGSNVTYATLNYDMIFETAVKCPLSYDLDGKFTNFLKLHGSVNLWPDTGGVIIADNNQFFAATPGSTNFGFLESPVSYLSIENSIRKFSGREIGPVIASYAEGKPVRICGKAVAHLQRQWQSVVKEADRVLIVGVRVVEQDFHIWKPLMETSAEVVYFGFLTSDCDSFDHWSSKNSVIKKQTRRGGLDELLFYIRMNL